jgi:hypothetical protein
MYSGLSSLGSMQPAIARAAACFMSSVILSGTHIQRTAKDAGKGQHIVEPDRKFSIQP